MCHNVDRGKKLVGTFTIHYNGELIAECENLLFTKGRHHVIEFDEPIQIDSDSPPMEITYKLEYKDAEHEEPKEPESPDGHP